LVLQSNGIDPDKDVRIIGLSERYAQVVDLMESDEIHGAVISEMNVSIGEYRQAIQIFKTLTEPAYCPTMQWMVVVANLAVIEEEPALISAVLRASRRGYRYALNNRDEFARFGAKQLGIDVATMIRSIGREEHDMHHDCEIDMAGLDLAIELQRKLGAFTSPLRAEDITDLRHLKGV
jgi:ABC-type nitrate/sulfonate/bicarbonate transport system substrate-binding protein